MRWWFSRRRHESELREEIEFDLELETREGMQAGLTPAEAREAARKYFGNVTQARESTREVWGGAWLERLVQDVRCALRSMRRNRAFTAAVVVSIGLGAGANTAMFSVVNAVLLRPLAFRDPGGLVQIWEHPTGGVQDRAQSSGPDYNDFRDQSASFEGLTALIPSFSFPLTAPGEPMLVRCAAFSPEFFDVFKMRPLLGHIYEPADYLQSGNSILLSHGFWQRRFGSDPRVLGKKIYLNHETEVVIGVMPPAPDLFGGVDVFMTYVPDYPWAVQRANRFLDVIGRLKPGVTAAQARLDLQAVYRRMPGVSPTATIEVTPLSDRIVGDSRPALVVLMAAVALVLLITCANVGNLLLARGAARQKEVATRLALGASRLRIVRQFVTESLVLALVGGGVGVALAFWVVDLLVKFNPGFLPRASGIRVDAPVLLFGLAISVLAGIGFGLAPALAASRTGLHDRLRSGRGEANAGSSQWGRGALVASEVAMAVILLVGAGLLTRSFWMLMSVDPGFRPDHVLTLPLRVPDQQANTSFYPELLQRVAGRPGVVAAGVSDCAPAGYVPAADIVASGRPVDPNHVPVADACWISPGYFDAMGIVLRKGRKFDQRDGASAPPVAVISAAMAEQLWPGEDPIGKRLSPNYRSLGRPMDDKPPPREVVGVVGDAHLRGLETPSRMAIYLPYQQDATRRSIRAMVLYVRSQSEPEQMSSSIRSDLHAIAPDVPVLTARSMHEVINQTIAPRTFTLTVLASFAGLALLLAAVGLYGVVSYSVARRTREIGIRAALGANRSDVLKAVIGRELRWLALGMVAGIAGAFAVSRLLTGLLFGVTASDALTYASVITLLVLVALAASLVPARRATRVDPVLALREE